MYIYIIYIYIYVLCNIILLKVKSKFQNVCGALKHIYFKCLNVKIENSSDYFHILHIVELWCDFKMFMGP